MYPIFVRHILYVVGIIYQLMGAINSSTHMVHSLYNNPCTQFLVTLVCRSSLQIYQNTDCTLPYHIVFSRAVKIESQLGTGCWDRFTRCNLSFVPCAIKFFIFITFTITVWIISDQEYLWQLLNQGTHHVLCFLTLYLFTFCLY